MTGCHYIQALFTLLCSMYNCFLSVISGFRHKVDENCTLLGCYGASSDNLLPMIRDNLLVPSSSSEICSAIILIIRVKIQKTRWDQSVVPKHW